MTSQGSSNGSGGKGDAGGRRSDKKTNNPQASLGPFIQRYHTEVSAGLSSILSQQLAFPLDSVKTRMQTYNRTYNGFLDCVRQTYRTEKLRGFFRGATAPLITVSLVRTSSFSLFGHTKHVYSDLIKEKFGVDVMSHVNTKGNYPNLWTVGCFGAAGTTAGAAITFFACPFELTKNAAQVSVLLSQEEHCPDPKRLALAASYRDKGTFRTMANIVKHRGFAGLYTGFTLHLLRDSLGTGLYFATYETSKQLLATFGTDQAAAVVGAGGLCGIVSYAFLYPIDTAKNRYQRNALMYYKGEKVIPVKTEWLSRHVYSGLGVSMARSCIVNAILFSSYEYLKKRIKGLDERKDMK